MPIGVRNTTGRDLTGTVGGRSVTIRAGGRYDFPTICAAASFMRESGASIVDNASGTVVASLNRQAEAAGCADRFNSVPVPETSTPPDETAGPVSPAQTGAPTPEPPATTEPNPTPYGSPGETRQPTEAVNSQSDPRPAGEVNQAVANGAGGGGASTDAADETRRATEGAPPAGEPRRDSHSGDRPAAPSTGADPVDLFSGAFVMRQVDLEVPTPFLPISLIRRYRSGKPYFGPLGFNWDHNWNVFLRELKDGSVARWTGELHEDLFRIDGGGWSPPRGVFERLTALGGPGVSYRIEAQGGLESYFERPPGWSDAERIPLVRITDADGNMLLLDYDAENRVRQVTDNDGRSLRFGYGDCGFLEMVQDHTGRTVRYYHDDRREHLIAVALPAVADTPEISESYEYALPNVHPAQRHNIIVVRDALRQALVVNTYGLDPSQQSFNRVILQRQGGFSHQFDYEMLQGLANDRIFRDAIAYRTTAQYPDGSYWVHSFNPTGELIDDRVRLSHDGSYRIVARRLAYDEEGNLASETEPDGAQTLRVYDALNPDPRMRGNVLRIERRAPIGVPLPSRIVMRMDYEPAFGRIRRIRYEGGAEAVYVYDFDLAPGPGSTGKLVRIDWPDATLPDGSVQSSSTQFSYNARGQRIDTIKPEGSIDRNEYFPGGSTKAGFLAAMIGDAGGLAERTAYDYDPAGYLLETVAPGGAVTRYHTDARGRRQRIEQPPIAGATDATDWMFHPNGQVARVLRPRGEYSDPTIADPFIEEQIEVDTMGRVTRQIVGANTARPRITTSQTDYRGRPVIITKPDGTVQRTCFDERGLLLFVTQAYGTPLAQTESYVHDRNGRIVRITRPGNRISEIEYDGWGRQFRSILPDGTIQETEYGDFDLPTEIRVIGDPGDGSPDRLLRRMTISYDERGRPVTTTVWRFEDDPALAVGLSETKWYDRDGRCVRRITPTGAQWLMAYDGMGRLIRQQDPLGNQTETIYGPDGRPARTIATDVGAAGIATTDFIHDARGRLIETITQDGQSSKTRYDARDYAVEVTAADGTVSFQSFGLLGEVEGSVADATGLTLAHRIENDLMGRPDRYHSPSGAVTALSRDALGRLTGLTLPDGSSYARSFDPASGDLVSVQTPVGAVLVFDRDLQGRMIGLRAGAIGTRQPVSDHSYRYDGLGRLITAATAGQTIQRRYDSLDRLVSEDDGSGAVVRRYDDLASIMLQILPDGWTERHRLDALGRVTQVSVDAVGSAGLALPAAGTTLVSTTYRGASRIAQIQSPATAELWTHDSGGRLSGIDITALAGAPLARIIYGHDAVNRRKATVRDDTADASRLFGYDGRGRLERVVHALTLPIGAPPASLADAQNLIAQAAAAAGSPPEIWSYGSDDERLTHQDPGGVLTTFGHGPDAVITSIDGAAVTSDPDGARLSDPGRDFVWDAFGRLVKASAGGASTQFEYDPLGRIAAVTRGTTQTRQRWFDSTRLELRDPMGAAQLRLLNHPNLPVPVAAFAATGSWQLHYDAHLDLVLVTAADGTIANRIRYAPFGTPTVLDAAGLPGALPAGLTPVFGAMPFEAGPGLYLTPKRPFDPATGHFLARDPALFAFSPNAFAFAGQDPVNGLDPEGDLAPLIVAGLIVGGIGALIGGASVVIRGGDYDAWDVLAAAGIGFGAGFIGAVTFGVAAEALGAAGLAGAAGAGLTGTATGTAATAGAGSMGVSLSTSILAGSASGLSSGLFSGFARANYDYVRHGGDYADMVGHGMFVEGTSGLVGGAVGGGLFGGLTRAGVIPTGYWASMTGNSSTYTRAAMTPALLGRGLVSPYGAGAAAIGFGGGYSGGLTRRLLEGESFGDASSNAVTDGAWGAGGGVVSTALHPTSWMYWRARFDPATAARIESIRGVGLHHQRNVAQYPEFATPRLSSGSLTWFERFYGENIIGGNLSGPNSTYANRAQHQGFHNLWRFGMRGSWTNMPGHGPWTPAWPVYTPPTDPRSTSHADKP